jgi:DNA mismatch endonuclease (patch repair protein)
MSRIRGFDSKIEVSVRAELDRLGIRYESNVMALPGRPDLVFTDAKLVVFIDGDFWHGYRYPAWGRRLSPYWKAKIERNRRRDRLNHAKLRRRGWRVVRLWAHQVHRDLPHCIDTIKSRLSQPSVASSRRPSGNRDRLVGGVILGREPKR